MTFYITELLQKSPYVKSEKNNGGLSSLIHDPSDVNSGSGELCQLRHSAEKPGLKKIFVLQKV